MVVKKQAARRPANAKPRQIHGPGTQSPYFRLLVYGNPGDLKTTLAGTSPRPLILNADRGTEILDMRRIPYESWEINDHDELNDAIAYIRHGGHKEYDWLWLDSITGFQELGLDSIMRELTAVKSHRRMWAADKGEYGQNMNRLSLALRAMRDLPLNVGWISHITRTEDDDGEVMYKPAVQGKDMIDRVCSYASVVGRMERVYSEKQKKEIVRFTTRKDGKYYTKDRMNIGTIVDPTIPKIMARIAEARAAGGRRPTKKATSTTKKAG